MRKTLRTALQKSGNCSPEIRLEPANPHAQSNLGVALARQGKLEQAIAHFRLAIAVSPDLAAAHNNLGDCLRAQGKVEDAIAAYRDALRADPGSAPAAKSLENARKLLQPPGAARSRETAIAVRRRCVRSARDRRCSKPRKRPILAHPETPRILRAWIELE